MLNAGGYFRAAAAAPVLLNLIFISALWMGSQLGWDVGLTLAWAVPIAGIAQLALVWMAAARSGFKLIPRLPKWTPELRRLAIIAGPAALAGGVVQVNLVIGRQVASYFEGANAWLYYADRLYQLPLGVVGIAVGIVLLPELSRRLAADDTTGGRDAMNRAAEFSLALTVPCAVALVVMPHALVSVLFERGSFGAADTAATAVATAIYGLGLPAFVLQKVLQPLFFAREDTKSPFYYAIVALVINAALAIGLAPVVGYTSAAIGATLAGWGMLLCLWWGSRRFGAAAVVDQQLKKRAPRIVLASLVMGAALWAGAMVLGPWIAMAGVRYLALAGLILGGMVVYALAGQILGAFSLAEMKRGVRR